MRTLRPMVLSRRRRLATGGAAHKGGAEWAVARGHAVCECALDSRQGVLERGGEDGEGGLLLRVRSQRMATS